MLAAMPRPRSEREQWKEERAEIPAQIAALQRDLAATPAAETDRHEALTWKIPAPRSGWPSLMPDSRATMPSRRERGFRRLALAISLLALCAGLAVTAHQGYRARLYLVERDEFSECMRELAPPTASTRQHGEAWDRCRASIEDVPAPTIPRAAFGAIAGALKAFPALDQIFDWSVTHFGAFTVAVCLALTGLLVALPWAVFYFARWIARGFDAPPSLPDLMHPTQIPKPFHTKGWVYEEKIDGWRMLAIKESGRVRLSAGMPGTTPSGFLRSSRP
jgi:hypothetical protein